MSNTPTPEDMEKLRHMVGATNRLARDRGWRNFYAPGPGDVAAMRRLVSAGLARRGFPYEEDFYYCATEAGCIAAGLTKGQTKRAMEGR